MDLSNQVHGEILMQDTTTNPKFGGGLLPSHSGERCEGVGEGGEVTKGDFDSGPPLISIQRCIIASQFLFF
jgi:hypothetical protein